MRSKNAVTVILNFAVSQLGLAKLPDDVKNAVQFMPNKVFGLLGKAISKITLTGTPSGKLYKGALTSVLAIGTDYQLWESRDEHGKAHVKVAKKNAAGQFELYAELKASSFKNNAQAPQATQNIADLITAAKNYAAELDKQKKTPTANGPALLKSLQQAVTNLQDLVKADIEHDACAALMAGCFASGTKLWTPNGYRNVEDIQPGEFVYSRDEWDPEGAIESKVVEAKFKRTGRILHLHLNGGSLIRTTPEHPFYERQRGWLEAGALQASDEIRTDSGWVRVGEVFDTGEYETVFNLRVADWHTYFVGEDERVWAHNLYDFISSLKLVDAVVQKLQGTGTTLSNSIRDQILSEVRNQGSFGPVGDVQMLAAKIANAVTSTGSQATNVTEAISGYFKLDCVTDSMKKQTDAINTVDNRQTVTGGQNYGTWKNYIQTKFSDQDVTGRTLAQYHQWLEVNGRQSEIELTHGHHVVFKKAVGSAAQKAAQEAKDILLYFGINPYWDQANLAYAPNPNTGGHTATVMDKIRDLIKATFDTWKGMSLSQAQAEIRQLMKNTALSWIGRDSDLGFPS